MSVANIGGVWVAIALLAVMVLVAAAWFLWARRKKHAMVQTTMAEQTEAPVEPAPRESLGWWPSRQKPCVVVTGLPEAGASTLIDHLTGSTGGVTDRAQWRIFDGVLLLDLPPQALLQTDGRPWEAALRSLWRRRPGRPVDAVVLAVTIAELNDESAGNVRARLDRLREQLGFIVPVYLVVTGCAAIPGFARFAEALGTKDGGAGSHGPQQMLGWSCGHRLDAAFTPGWVDEAYAELCRTLEQAQVALLGSGRAGEERDALLLMPERMMAGRTPLAEWLRPVFRTEAGTDPHLLRGIYFCGGGWLVRDLFERKIFPEFRLARPAAGVAAPRGRAEWAGRLAAAALALTLGLGSWWAYDRLQTVRDRHVVPLLEALSRAVTPDRAERQPELSRAFDFLTTVEALDVQGFRSIFLPASWNDPVDDRLERVLFPAFQELVVETCRRGLEQHMRKVGGASHRPVAEPAGPPLDLSLRFTNHPAYLALAQQLEQTSQLEDQLRRYQRLKDKDSTSIYEVNRMLDYLSAGRLPRAMQSGVRRGANPLYRRVIAETEWPALAGRDRFLDQASARTGELARAFLDGWIGQSPLVPAVEKMTRQIAAFEQGIDGGDAAFQELDDQIVETTTALASGAWDWVAADFARARWGVLGAKLDQMPFDRDDLIAQIETEGNQRQQVLAERLRQTSHTYAGSVLEIGAGKIQVAAPVRTLGTAIARLRAFAPEALEPGTLLPSGGAVGYLWDAGALRQAAALETSYAGFLREAIPALPVRFQPAMKRLAAGRVRTALVAQVTRARSANPAVHRDGADLERTLQPEVRSLAEAADLFAEVARTLTALGAPVERETLRRLMALQAAELLRLADQEFERAAPYRPQVSAMGATQLPAALYGASSKPELRRFLDAERERITVFARGYALPLLGVLEKLGVMPERTRAERWRGIQANLADYAGAKPGNPVRALESFVEDGLDKVRPEERCAVPAAPAGSDVFSAAERLIRERAVAICQTQLAAMYQSLAQTFNTRLAGRYPFTASAQPATGAGVDPRDVEAFFALAETQAPALEAWLAAEGKWGETGRRALEFLRQIRAVRPLFVIPASETAPVVGVGVEFRANQAREVGGNQIMDWSLRLGDRTVSPASAKTAVRWRHGDPVRVELRYAKDAPWSPLAGAGAPPRVEDRTAIFDFLHPWSLVQMLRENAASAADVVRGEAGQLVRLRVPMTGPGSPPPSVVFLRLRLEALAGGAFAVPEAFPERAPLLERSVTP